MTLESLQLRDEDLPASVVMVRQGSTTLSDEKLSKACEVTRSRWGIFGFSVHELPQGGFEELARLSPILRNRPRVLVASSAGLLGDGFPLFPSGTYPHWTIVLSESSRRQFSRVRSHFNEQANPSFDPRGR